MIVYSPSNVNLFDQCPRKEQAQYITREIVSKFDSPAALRGIVLHALLESSVKNGHTRDEQEIKVNKNKRLVSWADYPAEEDRCLPAIDHFAALKGKGWAVKVEFEAAINKGGKPCGWWDNDCLARAKIDILFVPPDRNGVFVWDWKTGKVASINEFQMPFTTMLLACYFGDMKYCTVDFMIDSEELIQEEFHPTVNLHQALHGEEVSLKFQSTVTTMRDMQKAQEFDQWPAKKNNFCRWCELYSRCKTGRGA